MTSWFDIEEIDSQTYVISEYAHPEKVHSYLLLDAGVACLIDTGLGIGNIREVIDQLTDSPITVITTHAHWDHIGGHGLFSNIYIHEHEADWLRNGLPMPISTIRRYILEEPITKKLPQCFDINNYFPFRGELSRELVDNDIIEFGKRKLRVIHTPGHSPGHICMFEERTGYLFTGDLLYKGTMYAFLPESDPDSYFHSVQKISLLPNVSKILPAHNDLNLKCSFINDVLESFTDLKERNLLKKGCGIYNFTNFKIYL